MTPFSQPHFPEASRPSWVRRVKCVFGRHDLNLVAKDSRSPEAILAAHLTRKEKE